MEAFHAQRGATTHETKGGGANGQGVVYSPFLIYQDNPLKALPSFPLF
jgi:hypothetical protein